MNAVTDNPAEQRFELRINDGGDEIAATYYRIEDGRLILTHTEVPPQFAGQGIGSQLARGVFDTLRASGRKAVLRCPFMAAYHARHREYSDIAEGENQSGEIT